MRKKIFAGILVLVMVFASVVGVSAEGSRTNGPTVADESKGDANKGYEIRTGAREFEDLNADVKSLVTAFNSSASKSLDALFGNVDGVTVNADVRTELAGKTLLGSVFDLHPINGGNPTDGGHDVTIIVPWFTDKVVKDSVRVLHYSDQNKTWEVLKPKSVDLTNKKLEVVYPTLSPVAIYAQISADSSSGQSPQTGGNSASWMVLTAAGLIVLGCGLVAADRKRR